MATRHPPARRRLASRDTRRPARPSPLRLVRLEDRCVPAIIVVTVAGEDAHPGDGNVSFREALDLANSNGQADTIAFAPGITAVDIADPAALHVAETGTANVTTIDGGRRVTLRRDGSAGAGRVLTIDTGAAAVLRGLTITGGNAGGGAGGLYVDLNGDATLERVVVRGNVVSSGNGAPLGGGGGIVNFGTTRLVGSSVVGNAATGDGGGILSVGRLLVRDSTVAGNSCRGNGGGIAAIQAAADVTPSDLVVLNSTVSDNVSGGAELGNGDGGGIYTSTLPTVLTNVTITNNRIAHGFGSGGGLSATLNLNPLVTNCIIAGNFASGGRAADLGCSLDPASSHNLIGGDLKLGELADNGGPTPTHALLPGSPAIDAGDTALAVDPDGRPLLSDQRGFGRVSGNSVDIGAYEFQDLTGSDAADLVVAGSGAGGAPMVNVYDAAGELVASFLAYDTAFAGGVNVALADVNGDGTADVVTGAGPGGGPHVKVFDGTKLWMARGGGQLDDAAVLVSFFAYDRSFTGGVNVTAGDLTGDGKADIVTGAGAGGGPHVKVFETADGTELASFFAYDGRFRGGVNVAVGDLTGDGMADVVTGAGAGGGPHVKAFDGQGLAEGGAFAVAALETPLKSFYAFDPGFQGGVSVAVGDVTGTGHADIVTGAGPGGGPHVRAFDGVTLAEVASFFAYDRSFFGGVDVATARPAGGTAVGPATALDIVTGAGPGGAPHVREFSTAGPTAVASLYAFDPAFLGGVFVG